MAMLNGTFVCCMLLLPFYRDRESTCRSAFLLDRFPAFQVTLAHQWALRVRIARKQESASLRVQQQLDATVFGRLLLPPFAMSPFSRSLCATTTLHVSLCFSTCVCVCLCASRRLQREVTRKRVEHRVSPNRIVCASSQRVLLVTTHTHTHTHILWLSAPFLPSEARAAVFRFFPFPIRNERQS